MPPAWPLKWHMYSTNSLLADMSADPTSKTSTGLRKASDKSSRTRAREFAVQALYQHKVGRNGRLDIASFTRDLTGFHKADSVYFDTLLQGCIENEEALNAAVAPYLDRPLAEISPIELIILWIGAYELQHVLEVPMRVVINESIELAKSFGGTDGHKFVNGVLHPLAQVLRPIEAQQQASKGASRA